MMTRADILTKLGWSQEMIHTLLQSLDSDSVRRDKKTGAYARGFYRRDRVLGNSHSTEGKTAKRRWDQTIHGYSPKSGWTMRLGDIGRELGITAVAVGKILEMVRFRSDRQVTDSAVAAGCGVRRWDGYRFHIDWRQDRVVAAIKSAAASPDSIANTLTAAIAKQRAKDWDRAAGANRPRSKRLVGNRRKQR